MPVDSKHKDYLKYSFIWNRCRTVVEGEDAVKISGTEYLPRLNGQSERDYVAYKQRALFYAGSSRTVQGLLGAIFRKRPEVNTTREILNALETVSVEGVSVENFAREVVNEVLITGRYGILVDMPFNKSGKPYLTGYRAEAIINWRADRNGGSEKLSLVVLEEAYQEPTGDPFNYEKRIQYRVLSLDDMGLYQVSIFRKPSLKDDWMLVDFYQPTALGKRLNYIPFIFTNSIDSTSRIRKSPIVDLVSVNLSHFRTSADLEHGRHFTALPTAWVAGFDTDTQLKIGSQTAWISKDSDAKAGYLEFTGQGLGALENALREKQDMMTILGARLLEEPKKTVEATETHRLRRMGESSVLASIARTISKSITLALSWWGVWSGYTDKIVFELNTDFMGGRLDANSIKALMDTWGKGALSWDSLMFNFKRGELLPEDRTAPEELELIKQDKTNILKQTKIEAKHIK